MPQELPGFYYDPQKNRYFPVKGPIPGSARKSTAFKKSIQKPSRVESVSRKETRITELLQHRELYGNIITGRKWKGSFQEEYKKHLASQPLVWKYDQTERIADGALGLLRADVQTPAGVYGTDVLLTGGVNGTLSLFEVGKVGRHYNRGVKQTAHLVWPDTSESRFDSNDESKHIWRLDRVDLPLLSAICSVKIPRKKGNNSDNGGTTASPALIATLGSKAIGGQIFALNVAEPWELGSENSLISVVHEVASANCTVWAVDSNDSGCDAIIGTDDGVISQNLERGMPTKLLSSKSAVLSLQCIQPDNVTLCGLRNGTILTVDARQRQYNSTHRIHRPQEVCGTSTRISSKNIRDSFKIRGNIIPDQTIFMPKSVSSLVSLQLSSQYFLASSMDGSVKLYDLRLTKRGAVQSYEGHTNSCTRIQLGVDPYERFVISGGEDSNARIWSLKSGELLYQEKVSNCTISTVCWEQDQGLYNVLSGHQGPGEFHDERDYGSSAWLGSYEGLFRLRFQ